MHTRTLDIEVRASEADPPIWDVRGELVDIRKGGYVPIAADLQPAGLLHHMRVAARFDPRTRTLLEISAEQPAVAFEASRLSEGESCRDPVSQIAALAGVALDAGWDRRLLDLIGGPRGCSHVLALARLEGATLAWLTEPDGSAHPFRDARDSYRAGERLFHRTLTFDGAESGDEAIALAFQLTDLHFAPAPELVSPMRRLAGQSEVRGSARLRRNDLELLQLEIAVRRRELDGLARSDEWIRPGELTGLVGAPVARGMRRRVLEVLPDAEPGAPLAAALLDLAPAALQCLASDCDPWPARMAGDASLVVSGGPPDSCWMWRTRGALTRARERERS